MQRRVARRRAAARAAAAARRLRELVVVLGRLQRDVVAEPLRLLVRVGVAADVDEQRRVVDGRRASARRGRAARRAAARSGTGAARAPSAARSRGRCRATAPRRARPAGRARDRDRRSRADTTPERSVEARGIEPLPQPCKGRVLPLSLRPLGWRPQDSCGHRIRGMATKRTRKSKSAPEVSNYEIVNHWFDLAADRLGAARRHPRGPALDLPRGAGADPGHARPTGGSTSSPATASSTTARAGRTRAASATTRRSTSTRCARSPR